MKEVVLSMNEQFKYETIKSLVDHNGNKKRAAVKLGYSLRHINRLINKYKAEGKNAFIHGNKNRKPAHAIPDEIKNDIVTMYNNKYYDATFAFASELLAEKDNIKISASALSKLLYSEFIVSPRTKKTTKKKLKSLLDETKKTTLSKKELNKIQSNIVNIEESHCRRPRCAYFGEMIQMDASLHKWFGNEKSQLHIAIDDSTSHIVGAYFDKQETLNGYYNVFHQILTKYGIPAMFYTDNRTVFEYKRKKNKKIEDDTFTQFGYACHQLGVELKTTSVAQAKGRVERAFQTLQQRLPILLRLEGITTLSEANAFLNSYIKKYNAKFALPINYSKSVFETQLSSEKINLTLAVLTERTVDSGHCIKFHKQYYRTVDKFSNATHFHRGTKALVIKTFDNQLVCCINDKIYALDPIEEHERFSKDFDVQPKKEEHKEKYIPDAGHPWRNSNFLKYRNHKLTDDMLRL